MKHLIVYQHLIVQSTFFLFHCNTLCILQRIWGSIEHLIADQSIKESRKWKHTVCKVEKKQLNHQFNSFIVTCVDQTSYFCRLCTFYVWKYLPLSRKSETFRWDPQISVSTRRHALSVSYWKNTLVIMAEIRSLDYLITLIYNWVFSKMIIIVSCPSLSVLQLFDSV